MGGTASIPGLGGKPGEGNGNPLGYSRLEYSMDRGAWWAVVHGVAESETTKQLTYKDLAESLPLVGVFIFAFHK